MYRPISQIYTVYITTWHVDVASLYICSTYVNLCKYRVHLLNFQFHNTLYKCSSSMSSQRWDASIFQSQCCKLYFVRETPQLVHFCTCSMQLVTGTIHCTWYIMCRYMYFFPSNTQCTCMTHWLSSNVLNSTVLVVHLHVYQTTSLCVNW